MATSPIDRLDEELWWCCVMQLAPGDPETAERWQADPLAYLREGHRVRPLPTRLDDLVEPALAQWRERETKVCAKLGLTRDAFLAAFVQARSDWRAGRPEWIRMVMTMGPRVDGAVKNLDWVNLFAWILPAADPARAAAHLATGRMVTALFYVELLWRNCNPNHPDMRRIEARWVLADRMSSHDEEKNMTNTATSHTFFDGKSVVPVSLPDWMAWASSGQQIQERRVVLPMIQRGSVWVPHKLLDLWDTLLRGMPVGAMMASEAVVGNPIKVLGEASTDRSRAGDISLIDGQQRTLSILAGWPRGLQNPLRPVAIWLDLTDAPQGEYRFRLWATTKAQPFGHARASMGGQSLSKLERYKLRLANQAWGKLDAQELWKLPDFMPWDAKFAIPLTELIDNKDRLRDFVLKRLGDYKKSLETKLDELSEKTDNTADFTDAVSQHFQKKIGALPTEAELDKQIPTLEAALGKVWDCEFPVIRVRQEIFADNASDPSEINTDPPLAILFKRVGTGGEPLSNADYVYSVIKHHANGVHDTVEALLKDEKVRAIYTPTTLVMSAVRLTMLSLTLEDGKGQKIADSAKLDKAAFARMVRNHSGFIDRFHEDIQPGGVFAVCLKDMLDKMSYSADFTAGFPKHALRLIKIPLLETILAWRTLRNPSDDIMEQSRLPMVRFVLQGSLCILDDAKASEIAIKALKEDEKTSGLEVFPDQELMTLLCTGEKAIAHPLPCPATLSAIVGLAQSPAGTNGLRGCTRFNVANDADKAHAAVYQRWWTWKGGHVHPMLLWLQRDYVFNTFEAQPALAGMDEETPFDFDHILPSAHWSYWTGVKNDRFIDFPLKDQDDRILDASGHWHIGNSIGNIHVLDSSDNRSLGDASVEDKLETSGFAQNALIAEQNHGDWIVASKSSDPPRQWNKDRALAFQRAVEKRAFDLYSKFCNDLDLCPDDNAVSPLEKG